MSLSEKLERAVDRDPWKVLTILAFALLGTVGGGGIWVGWVQGQVATIDSRVTVLEVDKNDLTKSLNAVSVQTSRMDARQEIILQSVRDIGNKMDSKADK